MLWTKDKKLWSSNHDSPLIVFSPFGPSSMSYNSTTTTSPPTRQMKATSKTFVPQMYSSSTTSLTLTTSTTPDYYDDDDVTAEYDGTQEAELDAALPDVYAGMYPTDDDD